MIVSDRVSRDRAAKSRRNFETELRDGISRQNYETDLEAELARVSGMEIPPSSGSKKR
ncbi:hypothetical protein [Thioalkalivibrio sp. HK1]|uniref:hypothetical protein n=1 Tax=Thioalkalivibrio sp. HK1 TaxID=1469245 RepID=UPI0004B528D1|nr:hypothetical protein [Thioalkalivibrio sp. HK1]